MIECCGLLYKENFMETEIIQFKDLEFRQAFYNPANPNFADPFSKLGDETFVEKYMCHHVWHIAEERWPTDGVLVVKSCNEDGCGICDECREEERKEEISMISPNGTSIAFTE